MSDLSLNSYPQKFYLRQCSLTVSCAPGLFICLTDCYDSCVLHDRCDICHNGTQNISINFYIVKVYTCNTIMSQLFWTY